MILKAKYQVYKDVASKYRFRLRSANNKILVVSEAYNSKQNCTKGIEAVKKNCGANIEDLTVNQNVEKRSEKAENQCVGVEVTGISMLDPPNVVESGSNIDFEGWLINNETGEGIKEAIINIWETDRSLMGDDVLASGVTDKDGKFSITWKAHQADWWDDTVEIYSKFDGKEKCKPVRSAGYKIKVV